MTKRTQTSLAGFVTALLLGSAVLLPAQTEVYDSLDGIMEAAGDDPTRLLELIGEQREAGADPVLLLETEIIYAIRTDDYSSAPRLARELEAVQQADNLDATELFSSADALNAMVKALQAQAALADGDKDAFKSLVQESFWLDPDLGSITGGWVKAVKQDERMATMRIPMETEILFSNGETTSLARLAEGKKAVLLDFWASWCGPCIRLMPELMTKAEKLEPQGIVVAGMNTEDRETAEQFRQEREIGIKWLVEPEDRVFSRMLAIDSIPRMILLTPEGEVLFNGHPMDDSLESALAEVGATL